MKDDVKYCPLKASNGNSDYYCDKEKCAWWEKDNGACTIVNIPYMLYKIVVQLEKQNGLR